jgi:hypothetical protein
MAGLSSMGREQTAAAVQDPPAGTAVQQQGLGRQKRRDNDNRQSPPGEPDRHERILADSERIGYVRHRQNGSKQS